MMINDRAKIGILLTDLGGMDVRALKYLILFQNTIQTSFEFQLMPVDKSSHLFDLLNSKTPVKRETVEEQASKFVHEYKKWFERYASGYELVMNYPDGIVILSVCKFLDNYYATGGDGWDIIALGNWERVMAPPSIVEFLLTLTLRQSIDIVCGDDFPRRHPSSKGCIFDFNSSIKETRYSVLTGYLCDSCCQTISNNSSDQMASDAKLLLEKKWLGDALQPTVTSFNVKKLGYDLFCTTGIKPTIRERLLAAAEKEAVTNIFKLVGGVILAGLLLWLGLK